MVQCIHCSRGLDKSWMTISIGNETTHLCSYICYRRSRDRYPKKLWPHVQNKEDFDDIRPVMNLSESVQTFHYLSYDELLQLSEESTSQYYQDIEDHMTLNPMISEIHHEQEKEDKRTREIEEEWEEDSNESVDDY